MWVPYDILEVLWMEIYNYDRSKTKLWCEKYLRGKQEVDLYSSFHETAKHNLVKVTSVPRSKGRPKFQLCPQQQLQMILQVFRTNTVESQRFITCMSFCLLTTEKNSVLLQNHWLHYTHKIFWKKHCKRKFMLSNRDGCRWFGTSVLDFQLPTKLQFFSFKGPIKRSQLKYL